jgi:hypothetical protein
MVGARFGAMRVVARRFSQHAVGTSSASRRLVIGDEVQLEHFAERSAQGRKTVIPANAGIHSLKARERPPSARTLDEWIPAFAGMTGVLA